MEKFGCDRFLPYSKPYPMLLKLRRVFYRFHPEFNADVESILKVLIARNNTMVAGESPDDSGFMEALMALHRKGRSLERIALIKIVAMRRCFRRAEREALEALEAQSALFAAGGHEP